MSYSSTQEADLISFLVVPLPGVVKLKVDDCSKGYLGMSTSDGIL